MLSPSAIQNENLRFRVSQGYVRTLKQKQTMGDLAADRPAWWRWAIFGALTKLKSAANDLLYTSQVALGLFGQCNAQASKVAH